jgi:hypothetical protein
LDQIRCIALCTHWGELRAPLNEFKRRLLRRLGTLTKADIDAVNRFARRQLDFWPSAMTLRLRDPHPHKAAAASSGAAKSAHDVILLHRLGAHL